MAGELQTVPAAKPAHTPRYKRLTRDDLAILSTMIAAGRTQVEVAQALGCDQSAVSKWVTSLTDTTALARSYLRGQALPMAQNIVKKGRAADHIKALEGIEVLSNQDVKGGLTIVIGSGSSVQLNVGSVGLSPSGIESGGEGVQNR